MKLFLIAMSCLTALAVGCLVPARAGDQVQLAQYYPPPPPPSYDSDRQRERDYYREQGRQEERAEQQWYNDQYRRRVNRYFGSTALVPLPGETPEQFNKRAHQQCNVQWDSCARYCNTVPDGNPRASCVTNCNNELYECTAGFGR